MRKSDLIINYLNYVAAYNSSYTYNCYKGHLEHIIFDVEFNIESVTKWIVREKKRGISNSTINKRINVLKRCLRFNGDYSLENIKTLKERYTTFDYLDWNQVISLIEYLNKSTISLKNKLIISLFLESGVRRKELMHIRWKNIDFKNRQIYLTFTKSNIPRTVCFSDLTFRYLYQFKYQHMDDYQEGFLFKNISGEAIESLFARIKKQLGFKKFSPYVLRHTYATILANNNCDINMLKETMGHQKITTTQRYIHYNKDLIKQRYNEAFKI